ncbi:MAG: PhzF family phenazine biosynthesis protein [Pseudomonadota bacterium]
MSVLEISAFSDGARGGNPAGVWLGDALPPAERMQAIAAEVGHSETVFASPEGTGWRARYFSPAMEVPFCGHATIALGAALALSHGNGVFPLVLNDAEITVEGRASDGVLTAALMSPPTAHRALPHDRLAQYLRLFGYAESDLDAGVAPAVVHAGADHLLIPLASRAALGRLDYALDDGAALMHEDQLITVLFTVADGPGVFWCRNAFAVGGVKEDPATGAAAAALVGYLRDAALSALQVFELKQGDDMGMPSRLRVECSTVPGSAVRVAGAARLMRAPEPAHEGVSAVV